MATVVAGATSMSGRAIGQVLPGGRLHLADGPIDLVIECFGDSAECARAYEQAWVRFATVLPELVRFLDLPIAILGPLQGVIFTALVMFFIFWRPQGLMGGKRAGGGLEAWTSRDALPVARRGGNR